MRPVQGLCHKLHRHQASHLGHQVVYSALEKMVTANTNGKFTFISSFTPDTISVSAQDGQRAFTSTPG